MASLAKNLKWNQSKGDDDGPTYSAEYASTGRAKCKVCKNPIAQGSVRLGKWVKSAFFDGKEVKWMHFDCFTSKTQKNCYGSADIVGVDDLRWKDQVAIRAFYNEITGDAEDVSFPERLYTVHHLPRSEQNRALWVIKDKLRRDVPASELKMLAKENGLSLSGGPVLQLDRVADGILYGVLPPCPECKGPLTYRDGVYECDGYTEWSKCEFSETSVFRQPWRFPPKSAAAAVFAEWLESQETGRAGVLLNTWSDDLANYVPTDGVFEAEAAAVDAAEREAKMKAINPNGGRGPLVGHKFALVGRTDRIREEYTELIELAGGKVVSSVLKATHVVGNTMEASRRNALIVAAATNGAEIVREDYVDAAVMVGQAMSAHHFALNIPNARDGTQLYSFCQAEPCELSKALVDQAFDERASWHVYRDGDGVFYDSTLSLTDIKSGVNSYYSLQVLERDGGGDYILFMRWGRVGTDVGDFSAKAMSCLAEAIVEFALKFSEKTHNEWADREACRKKPNRFMPVERDYDDVLRLERGESIEEGDEGMGMAANANPQARVRVADSVCEVVEHMFDPAVMYRTLELVGAHTNALPLGRLRRVNITRGYEALRELESVIESSKNPPTAKLTSLSNAFYSAVPHDFGASRPVVLSTLEMVKEKLRMVGALTGIADAYALNRAPAPAAGLSPVDGNLLKLGVLLTPLPADCDEYNFINMAVENTQDKRYFPFTVSTHKIFKITPIPKSAAAETEACYTRNYARDDNRALLWHGTRVSNLASILRNGLQVAPDAAPHTGYNFGKGVYTTDCVSLAASFCGYHDSDAQIGGEVNNTNNRTYSASKKWFEGGKEPKRGYLVLAEVARGRPTPQTKFSVFDTETLTSMGADSVQAVGMFESDPSEYVRTDDGVVLGVGGLVRSRALRTAAKFNEFVVYESERVVPRFVVAVDLV